MRKNITNVFCALNEARNISEKVEEIKNNGFDINRKAFPLINPLFNLRKDISFLKEDNIEVYNKIKKGAKKITLQLSNLNKEKINTIQEEIKKIETTLFNLLKF